MFTFAKIAWESGKLEAVSYDNKGKVASRHALSTAGEPSELLLSIIQNPDGFKADGADMALIQFEVVDKDGKRCPVDNRMVDFTLSGEAEWRGGIAQGTDNFILSKSLPVECGINRAIIRSTAKAGKITLTAKAEGLPEASITLKTMPVKTVGGLSDYLPQHSLASRLDRGETPSTPSYRDTKRTVRIVSAKAGSNNQEVDMSFDDNEMSEWANDGNLSRAWITYQFDREAEVGDISLKLRGWRKNSYPLEVYAGKTLIWKGDTEKTLGYIHLETKPIRTDNITISLMGSSTEDDAFGEIVEVEAKVTNEMEQSGKGEEGEYFLRIIEIDFLENI